MRIEEVRSQNEKYYCCDNYILLFRRESIFLSILFFIYMTAMSYQINILYLKQKYFVESTKQQLGYEDVMQWIEDRVNEHSLENMTVIILLFNIAVAVFIILVTFVFIKSYDLYKKSWIRVFIVVAYVIEAFFLAFYYNFFEFPLPVLIIAIKVFPIILSSRLLDPLGSRPSAGEALDWTKFFDCLDLFVFKK